MSEANMDIEKIKSLLDAIKNTDIEEIWLGKNGQKSGFKRKDVSALPAAKSKKINPGNQNTADSEPAPFPPPSPVQHIKSPIVGTFFRASSPVASPLVAEGDFVTVGQKVCIVEAMKVMKEVTSTLEGKIVKILVQNNHPVEYGQPIFEVDTKHIRKEIQ